MSRALCRGGLPRAVPAIRKSLPPLSAVAASVRTPGPDRLAMIEAGQIVPALMHDEVRSQPAVLEVDRLSLWYGSKRALFDVSLPIQRGKITAFIGPSGCGKSTLLRTFNRLNDLIDGVRTTGDVKLDGQSIFARDVDVTVLRQTAGMVFQKPNPFPMSIFENVAFPLRIAGENKRKILEPICQKALERAALWEDVSDRWMKNGGALELSGGQQQRLCIARAIVNRPEILLLDEPCSALDPIATLQIEQLLDELKKDATIVMVTHNMQQAARTSEYTAFFYMGQLVEYGATPRIFENPGLLETERYITGRFG